VLTEISDFWYLWCHCFLYSSPNFAIR